MAARYFVGGGTGNWNSTTNWSDTDGGASGFSSPVNGDTVFLTALSGANTLTINVNSACTSIDCTGFTGTLAGTSQLTVAGNVTFAAGMTITATGRLIISATSTITSNGKTWTGNLTTPSTSSTLTLADNLTISGLVTFPSVSGLATIMNGNILYLSGGLTHGNINSFSGTTKIIFNGTGTWSSNTSSAISNDIEINTSGTITFGTAINVSGSFKHTAGTVVVGTSTLRLNGSPTLDVAGINFYNIQTTSAITVTLLANLTSTNRYNLSGGSATFNGFTLYLAGIAFSNNIILSGTTDVVFNGTGTWSSTNIGQLKSNTTINTFGTLTISGVVYYDTGTLTYTAGTVDATGSTLTIGASTTLNTNGITWNNITITSIPTITINSLLSGVGTLTLPTTAVTFAGTHGFNFNNVVTATSTASRTYTLASTKTYTINNSFISISNTITLRPTFKSSVAGSQAILTLGASATQDLKFVNATDIDSSLGQTINSNKAVLSNATNWYRTNGTFMYLLNS